MLNLIEELRRRPKAVRTQVAFLVAFSVTGILFVSWAYNLSDRVYVESNDPVIAQVQRQQQQAEQAVIEETPETTVGSMFSRLQRGAAAIIFNDVAEPADTERTEDENTIDIQALISAPRPQPEPSEQIVVPVANPSAGSGAPILIGTSSADTAQNIE